MFFPIPLPFILRALERRRSNKQEKREKGGENVFRVGRKVKMKTLVILSAIFFLLLAGVSGQNFHTSVDEDG